MSIQCTTQRSSIGNDRAKVTPLVVMTILVGFWYQSESRIRHYQADLDRELAVLRYKKSQAMNNLAGATYEQSLSTEMQAVADRYKTNIQIETDRLAQLRSEASELRKRQDR